MSTPFKNVFFLQNESQTRAEISKRKSVASHIGRWITKWPHDHFSYVYLIELWKKIVWKKLLVVNMPLKLRYPQVHGGDDKLHLIVFRFAIIRYITYVILNVRLYISYGTIIILRWNVQEFLKLHKQLRNPQWMISWNSYPVFNYKLIHESVYKLQQQWPKY